MMDGDNFKPDTKFHIRVTARGEIDGPPSEPTEFTTGDGGLFHISLIAIHYILQWFLLVNQNSTWTFLRITQSRFRLDQITVYRVRLKDSLLRVYDGWMKMERYQEQKAQL